MVFPRTPKGSTAPRLSPSIGSTMLHAELRTLGRGICGAKSQCPVPIPGYCSRILLCLSRSIASFRGALQGHANMINGLALDGDFPIIYNSYLTMSQPSTSSPKLSKYSLIRGASSENMDLARFSASQQNLPCFSPQ